MEHRLQTRQGVDEIKHEVRNCGCFEKKQNIMAGIQLRLPRKLQPLVALLDVFKVVQCKRDIPSE